MFFSLHHNDNECCQTFTEIGLAIQSAMYCIKQINKDIIHLCCSLNGAEEVMQDVFERFQSEHSGSHYSIMT